MEYTNNKSETDFKTWAFYLFTSEYLSQIPKFLPSLSHFSPELTFKQNIILAKIDCCPLCNHHNLGIVVSSQQPPS